MLVAHEPQKQHNFCFPPITLFSPIVFQFILTNIAFFLKFVYLLFNPTPGQCSFAIRSKQQVDKTPIRPKVCLTYPEDDLLC